MVGWRHQLDGDESEQAPGVGDGQGGLAWCSPWDRRESDMTERLINNDNHFSSTFTLPCLSYIPISFFFYAAFAWKNPMDGGAWWAALHGVSKSQTRLSDFTFTFQFHALEKEMATRSSILDWRIPGMGEPGGRLSMGSHRVGHD